MERFGTEVRLMENQLYTVTLKIRGQEEKVVSFTSRYNPLFSTVRIVRSDFRDLFSAYSDDDINRLIYDNSKLAMELSPTIDPAGEDGIPHTAKQYVRYKTELDLATDMFLSLTAQSGQHDKQLGDLRVMRQVQLPYLSSILNILEKRVDTWELQLIGIRATPAGSVRAGASAFPINGRVSF